MDMVIEKHVGNAKRLLAVLPQRELNDKTRDFYLKTAKRFSGDPDKALDTTSKRTYYLRRAALSYYATQLLREGAEERDLVKIAKGTILISKFPVEIKKGESLRQGITCPIKNPANRVSKRKSLRGLPVDWREQAIQAAPDTKLKDWLMLMAVAGVRPSEIAKGVLVEPIEGGVKVTIEGSKTDRGHGQPQRSFEATGKIPIMLATAGRRFITAVSANAVALAVGRLGRKLWPKKAHYVSAYSFRHQVASDLKASDVTEAEISAALGHSVEETKRFYGNPLQRRGSIHYRNVQASREARPKAGRSPYSRSSSFYVSF